MPVSHEAFVYVTFAGIWVPSRLHLYHCYTVFIHVSLTVAVSSMGIALFVLSRNPRDFAQIGFLFVASSNAYVKGVNLLFRRSKVEKLRRMFLQKMCLTATQDEAETCQFYTLYARYTVIVTACIAEFTGFCVDTLPVFVSGEDDFWPKLPFKAWYPFEIAPNTTLHRLMYAHQAHALLMISAWNGGNDALFCAFLVELVSQLQLLTHRLKRLPGEMRLLRLDFQADESTIREREAKVIKQMAELVQAYFLPNMVAQFGLCTIIICLNIYQLAMQQSSVYELAMLFVYLNTMLIELLLYCWFGQELIYKSSNFNATIFAMDWTSLQVQTQKELLIMMKRAHTPISITCGPFITLSTESFTSILKCSYSMYNVLKQS